MNQNQIREIISAGQTALGIEFGSTRIKAVLIGPDHAPLASGGYEWENRWENGNWTYPLEQVWEGLQTCYARLAQEVQDQYGVALETIGAIGFSAMMHGYLVFDEDGELLTPFRTWRNTSTGPAAEELTQLFHFNIPQRWSIAHLYQAMLNGEEHLPRIGNKEIRAAGFVGVRVHQPDKNMRNQCARHGGNQPDRHIEILLQPPAEKITAGGKIRHRCRSAHVPRRRAGFIHKRTARRKLTRRHGVE